MMECWEGAGTAEKKFFDAILCLFVDRPRYFFIAVADADRHDATEEIQILVAVGVPDELVLGFGHHQRFRKVVENAREDVFLVRENDF